MSARAELSNTSGPVRFLVHYLEISSVRVPSNCQVWSTYHLIIFNLLSESPPATSHHQVTWLDIHLSGASPVSLREKFPCVLYLLSWLYHLPFIVRKRNYPSACLPRLFRCLKSLNESIMVGRNWDISKSLSFLLEMSDQWFFRLLVLVMFIFDSRNSSSFSKQNDINLETADNLPAIKACKYLTAIEPTDNRMERKASNTFHLFVWVSPILTEVGIIINNWRWWIDS